MDDFSIQFSGQTMQNEQYSGQVSVNQQTQYRISEDVERLFHVKSDIICQNEVKGVDNMSKTLPSYSQYGKGIDRSAAAIR